jgi:hypothetical protein
LLQAGGKAGKDSGKAKAKAVSRSARAGLQVNIVLHLSNSDNLYCTLNLFVHFVANIAKAFTTLNYFCAVPCRSYPPSFENENHQPRSCWRNCSCVQCSYPRIFDSWGKIIPFWIFTCINWQCYSIWSRLMQCRKSLFTSADLPVQLTSSTFLAYLFDCIDPLINPTLAYASVSVCSFVFPRFFNVRYRCLHFCCQNFAGDSKWREPWFLEEVAQYYITTALNAKIGRILGVSVCSLGMTFVLNMSMYLICNQIRC